MDFTLRALMAANLEPDFPVVPPTVEECKSLACRRIYEEVTGNSPSAGVNGHSSIGTDAANVT